jgi:hypothetical protein
VAPVEVRTHASGNVVQLISTLDALVQMGRRPGLRAKVHDQLLGILEAALEIRTLPGGHVDRAAPLVARVDDCEVSYCLDLENDRIHVLSVEPLEDGRPPPDRVSGWRSLNWDKR